MWNTHMVELFVSRGASLHHGNPVAWGFIQKIRPVLGLLKRHHAEQPELIKQANIALRWAVAEMERRYQLLAEMRVRDITAFNRKVTKLRGEADGAEADGNALVFNVGFSDPKRFELPKGIKAELADRGAKITLTGSDKEVIGEACAQMRAIRPPEPYKGKGIRMEGERVRRKVGKTGVA